jgi:hypothetical protein
LGRHYRPSGVASGGGSRPNDDVQRKVTRWRDYLDPIAVFDAVGWPASRSSSAL